MEPVIVTDRKTLIHRCSILCLTVLVLGFGGGAVVGVTLDDNRIIEVKKTKVERIAVAQLHGAGASMCENNNGLWNVEPRAKNLYTFHCKDGAQYRDISVNFKEESPVVIAEGVGQS